MPHGWDVRARFVVEMFRGRCLAVLHFALHCIAFHFVTGCRIRSLEHSLRIVKNDRALWEL